MNVIEVQDVYKKFRLYYDRSQTVKERLLFHSRNRHEDHWVLKGVSFAIQKGEAVGLIGENGCGKSTLLKLISQIIYPEKGEIRIQGRVSSLIELGAGFHPDMSGRENIYTNASIFGLDKAKIDEKLQTIIQFSELGDFIDNPVRTYSSGMYTRLAFSVAINVDADILLIDEILAVGDTNFQAKCFDKLREIRKSGTSIVIVSHSLGQIEQFCDRSLWIDNGVIRMQGKPREVHFQYLESMGEKRLAAQEKERAEAIASGRIPPPQKLGNEFARIERIQLVNEAGKPAIVFKTGERMDVLLHYSCSKVLENSTVSLQLLRSDGISIYASNTRIDGLDGLTLMEDGRILLTFDSLNLLAGEYFLNMGLHAADGDIYDFKEQAAQFTVYSDLQDVGITRLDHRWRLEDPERKEA
ncbi:MAG: ABC transporter ATP-binding protein [Provencibacterium sp.]|nr:ABC transporter ATP-binding protein [Provencibacterium sp.]